MIKFILFYPNYNLLIQIQLDFKDQIDQLKVDELEINKELKLK